MKKTEEKLYSFLAKNSNSINLLICENVQLSEKTKALMLNNLSSVFSIEELDGIELTIEGLSLLKEKKTINCIFYSEESISTINNIFSKKLSLFSSRVTQFPHVKLCYLI